MQSIAQEVGGNRAAHPRRGRAFTLVELLVVIAVMSALMTLLLPVLRSARRQSRTTKCLHNVRECAFALQSYMEDSRGMCPPWITFDSCQPPHGNAWWTCIHHLLTEYTDTATDVWTCPCDDTNDCTPWDGPQNGGDTLAGYRHGCSYVYNNGGGSSVHAPSEGLSLDYLRGKPFDSIANPSKKIAMFCWCAHNFWWGADAASERRQWWHSDPPELRAPVAFLDLSAAPVIIVPGRPETAHYQW